MLLATLTHDETRLFHLHLMLGVHPVYTATFLESSVLRVLCCLSLVNQIARCSVETKRKSRCVRMGTNFQHLEWVSVNRILALYVEITGQQHSNDQVVWFHIQWGRTRWLNFSNWGSLLIDCIIGLLWLYEEGSYLSNRDLRLFVLF